MIKPLSLVAHSAFADLRQKCLDASFLAQFPENGSFERVERKGRGYWYYRGYRQGADNKSGPRKWSRYVGPADDSAIAERVETFSAIRESYRERRELVSALVAMGLPRPDPVTGDVVERLWKAGLFRLRAVLVGTVAFQTYGGLLGVRLPHAQTMTGDVDLAQFHAVAMGVEDTIPPILETLREVDPTFREIPHPADSTAACAFVTNANFRVEFLTPNTGRQEYQGKPARMPALGGAAAQPLQFLDFLIRRPLTSVLLFKGGIPVTIPAPERYAIHKLILAAEGRADGESAVKARKDLTQAGLLIEALTANAQREDIGFAWMEAWGRGPGWQSRLLDGRRRLEAGVLQLLEAAVRDACGKEGREVSRYGFGDGVEAMRTLTP